MINGETTYHRLKRWKKPVYIVSDNLPEGRGFYTVGDDGISNSDGEDPDDINSWNYNSASYYYRRLWRRRYAQYAGIAMVPTIFVALAMGLGRSNNKKPNKPVLTTVNRS